MSDLANTESKDQAKGEFEAKLKLLESNVEVKDQAAKEAETKTQQTTTQLLNQTGQPWTPALVGGLSFGLMVFAVILFAMIQKLISDGKVTEPAHDAQWFLRIIVVPLCILGAVLLVIVGYSTEQSSPALGLLGTIIAYLLGSSPRTNTGPAAPPAPPPATPPPAPVP
jgi:hypothetical protein